MGFLLDLTGEKPPPTPTPPPPLTSVRRSCSSDQSGGPAELAVAFGGVCGKLRILKRCIMAAAASGVKAALAYFSYLNRWRCRG